METQKPRRVASLQPSVNEIGEICYRALGRGDAVEASRKLPAHPRVLALTMPRHLYVAVVATWSAEAAHA